MTKRTKTTDGPGNRIARSVRIDYRVCHEFRLAVEALGLTEVATYRGEPPTMEVVTAALWLHFSRLTKEQAEKFLVGQFATLDQIEGSEASSARPSRPATLGADDGPKAGKRKGRAG